MRQLREFAERMQDFDKAGVSVVAISVDGAEASQKVFKDVAGGRIRILSDPELVTIKKYGLLHAGGRGDKDIAIRATLLIDKEGREQWRRVSTSVQETPTVDEILERIAATKKAATPDPQGTKSPR